MYSITLELFDKKDFLKAFAAVSRDFVTDAVYSGSGFGGEDVSIMYIAPSEVLSVDADTGMDVIKDFAFSDARETLGFLSYDYGLALHGMTASKQRWIEFGRLCKYSAYARHHDSTLTIESGSQEMAERIAAACARRTEPALKGGMLKSAGMSADEYITRTAEVIEDIRDGRIYQLNLSIEFKAASDDMPADIWAAMAGRYPAPFYAFLNTDSGCILSTSPERFLKVCDGEVISQPIKGTLGFDEYSPELEDGLTGSAKESAELSMIVDLIRNDISGACGVGSVRVDRHKAVMRVDSLLQMYSDVSGTLSDGKDVVDLLMTAFPGGSVTGCPKKRAMELIDAYEPHARGIYCGSIFRITDRLNMDSSIAIRTAFQSGGEYRFFAGSGIVADSDPEKEYYETMSKTYKFLEFFK